LGRQRPTLMWTNLLQCLARFGIVLRLGNADVVGLANSFAELLARIEVFNRPVRMKDFPDELNPLCLAGEKAIAFLEGVPLLPDKVLESMRNGVVALEGEHLQLLAPSPITAERIRQGFSLEVPAPYFDRFLAPRLLTEADLALAADRANQAKAAMQ